MGNAQSEVAVSRRSRKPTNKKSKAAAPPAKSSKGNKNDKPKKGNNKKQKGGKSKKSKKHVSESEYSDEEEFDRSEDELLSGEEDGSGSGSDAESEGPSEAPSSFLGDDSDGEGIAEDEDDSGLASMAMGKKIIFSNGMFCSFGVHSVNIAATVGSAYLERYKLTPGQKLDYDQNAHSSLFEEVQQWFPFTDDPAGSAILVSRVVNWILRENENGIRPVSIGGTVGKDDNGNLIIEKILNSYNFNSVLCQNSIASTSATISLASKETAAYPTVVKKSTLSGSAFKMSDFKSTNTPDHLNNSKVIYLSGYFIANSPDTALEIARYANEKGKIVALSLSAPYICQFNKTIILQIMQYVDYLFATEEQLVTFCREVGLGEDLEVCSSGVARLPKVNSSRRRIVVVQNGDASCLVGQGYGVWRGQT